MARAAFRVSRRLPTAVVRTLNTARGIETPQLVTRLLGDRPVVVAPHPDDELIGAGGALRRHVLDGRRPKIVHVTSGERTAGLLELPPTERAAAREAEARAAAATLGIDAVDVVFLRLADGGVGASSDDGEVLHQALAGLEPDLLYAPWPVDVHRDHTATARLVGQVVGSLPSVARVALYEVWSPLAPTHLVDIGDHLQMKLDALGCYHSALRAVDYRHTAQGMAAYRSAQGLHGRGYAEAFCLLEPDAFIDLLDRFGG